VDEPTCAQVAAAHAGPLFSWTPAFVTQRRTAGALARVRLAAPGLPGGDPGQFVLVRPLGAGILPRALSVFDSEAGEIELFIKAEGVLRRQLAEAPIGGRFEMRGPHGVRFSDVIDPDRTYLLIGGGCGIAPLHRFERVHPERVSGTVYGFRSADARRLLPGERIVCEETDGEMAHERARSVWRPGTGVIACGPEPMLRRIAQMFRGEPGVYLSLECRIGCGIGACRGCSIPTIRGTRRVCKEGPLFSQEEVSWLI